MTNNKGFNEKEITATYMITMLTKYETMQIMKDHFGEKFDDNAERLFHQQYDYMEQFVESPSRFSYLFIIETGNEVKKELEMSEEVIEELTRQLMVA